MKIQKNISGAALAITAASLFSVVPMSLSASDSATGKCLGGNNCKGQSFCHTAISACAGQNSCKGKGWIKATKEECEKKGGEYKG